MLDDGMMVVKVPEYARSFEVALKDAVVPGLSIGNSEIRLPVLLHRVLLSPADLHQRDGCAGVGRSEQIQAHQPESV